MITLLILLLLFSVPQIFALESAFIAPFFYSALQCRGNVDRAFAEGGPTALNDGIACPLVPDQVLNVVGGCKSVVAWPGFTANVYCLSAKTDFMPCPNVSTSLQYATFNVHSDGNCWYYGAESRLVGSNLLREATCMPLDMVENVPGALWMKVDCWNNFFGTLSFYTDGSCSTKVSSVDLDDTCNAFPPVQGLYVQGYCQGCEMQTKSTTSTTTTSSTTSSTSSKTTSSTSTTFTSFTTKTTSTTSFTTSSKTTSTSQTTSKTTSSSTLTSSRTVSSSSSTTVISSSLATSISSLVSSTYSTSHPPSTTQPITTIPPKTSSTMTTKTATTSLIPTTTMTTTSEGLSAGAISGIALGSALVLVGGMTAGYVGIARHYALQHVDEEVPKEPMDVGAHYEDFDEPRHSLESRHSHESYQTGHHSRHYSHHSHHSREMEERSMDFLESPTHEQAFFEPVPLHAHEHCCPTTPSLYGEPH